MEGLKNVDQFRKKPNEKKDEEEKEEKSWHLVGLFGIVKLCLTGRIRINQFEKKYEPFSALSKYWSDFRRPVGKKPEEKKDKEEDEEVWKSMRFYGACSRDKVKLLSTFQILVGQFG